MRLQRLLLSRLNRSIDHAEAVSEKIGTFIESIRDGNNIVYSFASSFQFRLT